MIATSSLAIAVYYLSTDLLVTLIVYTVFPLLVIGIAVKFMSNLGKN